MAKYSNTKAKINEKITTNSAQAITGNILNDVLQAMVDSLGADYQFGGLVQPGSTFTAGEQPVVFLATTPGTYTNFGGFVVADGEVALLVWSGTAWSKQTPDIATRTEVSQLGQKVSAETFSDLSQIIEGKYLNQDGSLTTDADCYVTPKISVSAGDSVLWDFGDTHILEHKLLAFTIDGAILDYYGDTNTRPTTAITLPANTAYIRASMSFTKKNDGVIKVNGTIVWSYPYIPSIVNAKSIDRLKQLSGAGFNMLNTGYNANLVPNVDDIEIGAINDSTGEDSSNISRLRTGYIPVSDTKFFLVQSPQYVCEVLCYKNENNAYTYLGYTNEYGQDGEFEFKTGTTHIRLLIKDNSTNYPKPSNECATNLFVGEYTKTIQGQFNDVEKSIDTNTEKVDELKDGFLSLDKYQNCYVDKYWSGYDSQTVATGYIAGYIIDCPINVGDSVEWGIADGANPQNTIRLNFYNANGENIDYWGSMGGVNGKRTTDSFSYQNVKKVAISGLYSENFKPYLKVNGTLVFEAQKTTGSVAKSTNILHLKVTQWNMGNLNYGLTGPMPDAELETAIPLLKRNFTNIRADILFINECKQYINQGDSGMEQMPLYETLLKQFYPYRLTSATDWMGCFSKVKFSLYNISAPSGGSRAHKFGIISMGGGIDIAVAFVHCSPFSVSERVAELTAIAAEFEGYEHGIIVGDTNITNNSDTQEEIVQQMQPLLNAGFIFANMGYWGLIPTLAFNPSYPTLGPTMSTDNIIVKGLNIDYFQAFVEKDQGGNYQSYYSDHYPIMAEITSSVRNY